MQCHKVCWSLRYFPLRNRHVIAHNCKESSVLYCNICLNGCYGLRDEGHSPRVKCRSVQTTSAFVGVANYVDGVSIIFVKVICAILHCLLGLALTVNLERIGFGGGVTMA